MKKKNIVVLTIIGLLLGSIAKIAVNNLVISIAKQITLEKNCIF